MDLPAWLTGVISEPVAIATLVLALVTAILAGASFWTIRQTYNIRKTEKRERLLNEIIEWATEIQRTDEYDNEISEQIPPRVVPYAVWTGSFNLFKTASLSFENAVLIKDFSFQ